MLSSLKPAVGKFVLGPPVDTMPPVVVFNGPADHPDPIPTAKVEGAEKSAKTAEKTAEKPAKSAASAKAAKTGDAKTAKPAKQTKPKVTSSTQ
jgi:hypothetical protein